MFMANWVRRVLVVDDEPFVVALVTSVLEARGFQVASCGDATTARRLAEEFDPDIAIMDINLGQGPSGVQLGFVLSELHPAISQLYLTRYPAAAFADVESAERTRNHPVVSKDDITDTDVLIEAIEAAIRGQRPEVADSQGHSAVESLTQTQLAILKLISQGLTNSAIAQLRGTSERAVEKQLRHIYEALNLIPGPDQNARVLAAIEYRKTLGASSL